MALLLFPFLSLTAIVQLIFFEFALSQRGPYPKDGHDLASFMSRPTLRPPLFNVTNFNPDRVSPGFWFLAPYRASLLREDRNFQPFQMGPTIYDSQGNLIWSGAPSFHPRIVFDFRVTSYHGSPHLSFILTGQSTLSLQAKYRSGAGLILDNSYTIRAEVNGDADGGFINIHEFNVINEGQSALIIHSGRIHENDTNIPGFGSRDGFREVEIASGKILFDWRAMSFVELSESRIDEIHVSAVDYFHMNSVDKNAEGDYLISLRYTDCIYKVSGTDGSIIWRLGGTKSDFVLDGFNFSSQHNARFLKENSTTTIISFLNNAADDYNVTANYSSAMFVALHTSTSPMTASLVARYDRPDRNLTYLRGNVQVMPNKNIVVSWGENGYLSEFTPDGECILEASFKSHRFATYRAYKFEFTASPSEPPALKAYAFGVPPSTILITYYVSWNGATEIDSWNFYGSNDPEAELVLIKNAANSGFETESTSTGFFPWVLAEAVAADGRILGRSQLQKTIVPPGQNFAPSTENGENLSPNDYRLSWGTELQQQIRENWVTTLILIIESLIIAFLMFLMFSRKNHAAAFAYGPIEVTPTEVTSSEDFHDSI